MLTIAVETLRAWLAEGRPVTMLDVRPAAERDEWSIPGSIHIDAYDALKANNPQALDGVILPENEPVVTICGAGKTSLTAARQLQARGIHALSLEGGMQAWSLAWNSAEVPLPGSGARVIQVRRTGKGCLSYLIGSEGLAAVVDPSLPPQVYLDLAQAHGWRIALVLETHIHADHLSRGRDLAARAQAHLSLPEQRRVSYAFMPVREGTELVIGAARLSALHTPGHTPESTCYLLDGRVLFSGDTLFLESVGRPDLHADASKTREQAHRLFHSLRRLAQLPAETTVLPGHSSHPVAFDRQPLGASHVAVREWLGVRLEDEEAFVASILARLPPTPPNYKRIIAYNEAGELPEQDVSRLEAGANRCAIA